MSVEGIAIRGATENLECEEALQGGVAMGGSILLDPMGDAGEEANGEVADKLLRSIGGVPGEEAIVIAPKEKGERFDDGEAAAKLAKKTAAAT